MKQEPRPTAAPCPRVAIILLNYNGWKDTLECLESLKKLVYPCFEIIIVDNASTDKSWPELQKWRAQDFRSPCPLPVTLLQSDANKGYAGGNNIGIRHALEREFDYVWLLNNDTIADPGSLKALADFMESNPKTGMAGSTIFYYGRSDEIQCYGGGFINPWLAVSRHYTLAGDASTLPCRAGLSYINGASIFARTETIKNIGLLDEQFFIYWEDADWSLRAQNAGWKIAWVPDSKIWHKEGKTAKQNSPFSEYHHARSGMLFFAKHRRLFYPWIQAVFAVLKIIRRLPAPRAKCLGRTLKGLLDGLKSLGSAE